MSREHRFHRVRQYTTSTLDGLVRGAMFLLHTQHAPEADPWAFYRRLSRTQEVMLLRDGDGWLRGFCTLLPLVAPVDGSPQHAVLTLDMVVQDGAPGGPVLRRALLGHLWRARTPAGERPAWLVIDGTPAARLAAEVAAEVRSSPRVLEALAAALPVELGGRSLRLFRPTSGGLLWAWLTGR